MGINIDLALINEDKADWGVCVHKWTTLHLFVVISNYHGFGEVAARGQNNG